MNTTVAKIEPKPPARVEFLDMIERVARDPSIDLDKMERLLQMREREQSRIAEQAFNAAMALVQADIEPIRADSANPQTRSVYASYAALDREIRPSYAKHGFCLTFNTGEARNEAEVRILCDVSHADGFTRHYGLYMPADGKGARGNDVMTKTHAMGSAITYGKRYLLGMIFNLAVYRDDDGNAAGWTNNRTPSAEELIKGPDLHEEAKMAAEAGKDAFSSFCRRLTKHEYAALRPYLETLKPVVEKSNQSE